MGLVRQKMNCLAMFLILVVLCLIFVVVKMATNENMVAEESHSGREDDCDDRGFF